MKWFRFYCNFVNNPRIGRMPDRWQLALVKLMCEESKEPIIDNYPDFDGVMSYAVGLEEDDWRNFREYLLSKEMLKIIDCRYLTHVSGPGLVGKGLLEAREDRSLEYRKHRDTVFHRDEFACVYCGATKDLSLDHVIPQSRGGSDCPSNLVCCCQSCNSSKGDRTPQEWSRK